MSRRLRRAIGWEVRFGRLQLALWPPGLVAREVKLRGGGTELRAGLLRVELGPWEALRGRLELRGAMLRELTGRVELSCPRGPGIAQGAAPGELVLLREGTPVVRLREVSLRAHGSPADLRTRASARLIPPGGRPGRLELRARVRRRDGGGEARGTLRGEVRWSGMRLGGSMPFRCAWRGNELSAELDLSPLGVSGRGFRKPQGEGGRLRARWLGEQMKARLELRRLWLEGLEVHDLEARARLRGSTLWVDAWSLGVGDGRAWGRMRVELEQVPVYSGSLWGRNIPLGPLLAAFLSAKEARGTLSLRAQLQRGRGLRAEQLRLHGWARAQLRSGSLPVGEMLRAALGFAPPALGRRSVPLEGAVSLELRGRTAILRRALLQGPELSLSAGGKVRLEGEMDIGVRICSRRVRLTPWGRCLGLALRGRVDSPRVALDLSGTLPSASP